MRKRDLNIHFHHSEAQFILLIWVRARIRDSVRVRTRQDKTRQDKTRQDKTRQDKLGLGLSFNFESQG